MISHSYFPPLNLDSEKPPKIAKTDDSDSGREVLGRWGPIMLLGAPEADLQYVLEPPEVTSEVKDDFDDDGEGKPHDVIVMISMMMMMMMGRVSLMMSLSL
jgi:hypothetical protein